MLLELKRWSVRRKHGNGVRRKGIYRCGCGSEFEADCTNVARGNTTQCKACSIESRSKKRTIHGHSNSVAPKKSVEGKCYYTWQAMKRRCYNERENRYDQYGGRGIAVCARWLESYENFLSDMGLPPTMIHSIERIDNDGNYEPDNCKWITIRDQASNKSNTRHITVNGETKTLAQWARLAGVGHKTITNRLDLRGWSPEMAVQPVDSKMLNKYQTPEGEFKSLSEMAEHYGISASGVHSRIKSAKYPEWIRINRKIQCQK